MSPKGMFSNESMPFVNALGAACRRPFALDKLGMAYTWKKGGEYMRKQSLYLEPADDEITVDDKIELVDVSGLTFDYTLPREQRAAQALRSIQNPYCFRVGDLGVKVEFPEDAPTLQDCLSDLLQRKMDGL